jgi:hypothetical protein
MLQKNSQTFQIHRQHQMHHLKTSWPRHVFRGNSSPFCQLIDAAFGSPPNAKVKWSTKPKLEAPHVSLAPFLKSEHSRNLHELPLEMRSVQMQYSGEGGI